MPITRPMTLILSQVSSVSENSAGGGHDDPLQYSCWENPADRRAWRGTVHGVAESHTTEGTKRARMLTHRITRGGLRKPTVHILSSFTW